MTHALLPPPPGMHFAIIAVDQIGQNEGSICGVGTTPDGAWKDAREWVERDDLHWFDEDADREGCPYVCLPCDEAVAAMVEAEGGQIEFEVRRGRIRMWAEDT